MNVKKSVVFISIISIGVFITGCTSTSKLADGATANVDLVQKKSFTQKPFQLSYVDVEALAKVSALRVGAPKWNSDMAICHDRINLEKEIYTTFSGTVGVETLLEGDNKNANEASIINFTMLTCEERVGSALGVENPASVSFLITVNASDGQEIWSGTFNLKDAALFDNLLAAPEKLKIGAGWLTANDLIQHGLKLAAKDFESQRARFFISNGFGTVTN